MSTTTLLIIILAIVIVVGAILVWFFFFDAEEKESRPEPVGTMLSRQRGAAAVPTDPDKRRAFFAAMEGELSGSLVQKMTLQRRMYYAQLKMTPTVFWMWVVGIGLVSFILSMQLFALFLSIFFAFTGYFIMTTLVNMRMERRSNAFDRDYPQFLMSFVGLLKTGMNTLSALEATAEGLEPDALVREEVQLMIERLRFGVPEEKSIGTFGEDIHHPEIELFVQALLLNKRLGGNLSDTLERLAKQVRRRQYFRQAAIAAIGLQRGSLIFIIAILFVIQIYLYFVMPEAIYYSMNDEYGWLAWQGAFLIVILGILWLRAVTKLKI